MECAGAQSDAATTVHVKNAALLWTVSDAKPLSDPLVFSDFHHQIQPDLVQVFASGDQHQIDLAFDEDIWDE